MANLAVIWFGFIVLSVASSRLGALFTKIRMPVISGYVIIGILVGPYCLQLVESSSIFHLRYITQFAVAFISFSAGAELYLPELKALFKRIVYVTVGMAFFTFIFVSVVWWAVSMGGLVAFMGEYSGACQYCIGMVVASIMIERSPASAIAVVRELRAKGEFTSSVLGVTVFCDVWVLVLFTLTSSIAQTYCNNQPFNVAAFGVTIGCIICACLLGYVIGQLLILLLWAKHPLPKYFIPPLGFILFLSAEEFLEYSMHHWGLPVNLDPLLICIVGGYIATNQSRNRRKFLQFLSNVSPYIFIPFFTLTGAAMNLKVFLLAMQYAPVVVVVRAVCIFLGSFTGGQLTGMPTQYKKTMWMGLLAQAGLSLGLAAQVAVDFDAFGSQLQTALIAIILINLMIGPLLCKISLNWAGEAGKATLDEEHEEHGVKTGVFIGVEGASLSVAQTLLKSDWNVVFFDRDEGRVQRVYEALEVPVQEKKTEEGKEEGAEHVAEGAAAAAKPTKHHVLKEHKHEEHHAEGGEHEGEGEGEAEAAEEAEGEEEKDEEEVQLDSRLLNPQIADIVRALEEESHDLYGAKVAVVHWWRDDEAAKMCMFLQERLNIPTIICIVNNPAWAKHMAKLNMITVHNFSLQANYLSQLVQKHVGPIEMISATEKSMAEGAYGLIAPEAADMFELKAMSLMEKDDFQRDYPAPPADFWQDYAVKLKLNVVPEAQREQFMDQLSSLHHDVHHEVTQDEENAMNDIFESAALEEDKRQQRRASLRGQQVELEEHQ